MKIYGKINFLSFGSPGHFFNFFYGFPEAQEASRNLPGVRGSVVAKYQPVATHGDPIHAQITIFLMFLAFPDIPLTPFILLIGRGYIGNI